MRVLIVTWDGGGNVPPALALGRRLLARGHRVRVVGSEALAPDVEQTGCEFEPFVGVPRWATPHGRFHSSEFGAMVTMITGTAVPETIVAALQCESVDAMVVDCFLLNAFAVAEREHIPCAALFHLLYQPHVEGSWAPVWDGAMALLNSTRTQLGVAPMDLGRDVWDAQARVLVATPPELDFALARPAPNVCYVGPIVDGEVAAWPDDLPWRFDSGPPLVVVSFSTNDYDHLPVLQRVLDAVAGMDVRALVTVGPAIEPDDLIAAANTVLRRWAPHSGVLPHASVVVTHGGHGTVMSSLTHGVALVCIPTSPEQGFQAERIGTIGAGRPLTVDASVDQIKAAIDDVMSSATFGDAAQAVAASIERLRGGTRAVAEVEEMTAESRVRRRRHRPFA